LSTTLFRRQFKEGRFFDRLKSVVDECEGKLLVYIVIDNAPSHTMAERIVEYPNGTVQITYLWPYSLALNG
jgi:hypothetical protein